MSGLTLVVVGIAVLALFLFIWWLTDRGASNGKYNGSNCASGWDADGCGSSSACSSSHSSSDSGCGSDSGCSSGCSGCGSD